MRKFAAVLFLGLFVIGFSSCKKCATCTSTVTDPNLNAGDSLSSEEFCERGHVYDNQLETFERAGWKCTEN